MQQENINVVFGRHLRRLREKIPKALTVFAYENDLDPANLSRIENGLISTRLETLKKIADALEMSLGELLQDF
jgi:transcriptional regulator with XRE-family HTH domain